MRAKSRPTPVRKRVWNLGRLLILMVALVATFAVFFLTAMRVTSRARDVEVPNLHGKSMEEARALLAQRGLSLRIEDARRPDKAVPADHVLTQEPAAGQIVRRERAIRVRLSDGQRAAQVPPLVEYPERTAEMMLESDRIAIGYKAEVRSADYKPGVVIAQDPPSRERADAVNLLVNRSDGTVSYVVPDLIGTLGIRAADVLRGLGFRVAVAGEVAYPGLPQGIVVRQTPQAGYQIAATEPITLEVSK